MGRSLLLALSFLTRLPLPPGPTPLAPQQLGAAVAWFPLVGAAIGAGLWSVQALVYPALGAALTGIALVALSALVTGGLHLDGLADVFDAVGGGHGGRERMLEIMRDPRIGAHGATALGLVLAGKCVASGELLAGGRVEVVFFAPICGRFAGAVLIRAFPYARPEGLGRHFHDHAQPRHLALAAAITALALIPSGLALVVPALVALLVAVGFGAWLARRLGGLTGDAYGAAIELAELIVLIAARAG